MSDRARQPRVGIGLPVYNGQRYVGEALESLLSQTFSDFEIVICDNASTDATQEICRAYAEKDSRIRYVRNERNIGVAKNFNATFSRSNAPYFKWAACDDLIAPDLLGRCVTVLDADPGVILAYAKAQFVGPLGEKLSKYEDGLHLMQPSAADRLSQLVQNLGYCNLQYGLIRADVLRRTGLFGPFIGSDQVFLAELTLHGRVFQIPDYLLFRRLHPDASTNLSQRQLASFYDLGARDRPELRRWRHLREHFAAARRAPLNPWERVRVTKVLLRKAVWERAALAGELRDAMRPSASRRTTEAPRES